MPDIATERAHLAQADRHISEGETRVFRQAELVTRLHAGNQDSAQAEILLRNLRETLLVWKAHRLQILSALDSLQG